MIFPCDQIFLLSFELDQSFLRNVRKLENSFKILDFDLLGPKEEREFLQSKIDMYILGFQSQIPVFAKFMSDFLIRKFNFDKRDFLIVGTFSSFSIYFDKSEEKKVKDIPKSFMDMFLAEIKNFTSKKDRFVKASEKIMSKKYSTQEVEKMKINFILIHSILCFYPQKDFSQIKLNEEITPEKLDITEEEFKVNLDISQSCFKSFSRMELGYKVFFDIYFFEKLNVFN